jgi:hypothetical protein
VASSRRRQNLATFVLLVLLAFAVNSFAQSASPSSVSYQETAPPAQAPDQTKHESTPDTKNAKLSPADARKAQILEDTNRLYRMAEELKAEVAKSNKDILSVAVVKKADEIEKLAKSLKERMRSE